MSAVKYSPIRVLTRPTAVNSSIPSNKAPIPAPNPDESLQVSSKRDFPDKVVVVGFIGRRSDDVSQLLNRILDSNVFGSGKAERDLIEEKEPVEGSDELREWLKRHRIRYYHEEERGIVFVQLASVELMDMVEEEGDFEAAVDDMELGVLQGMLLMFSVCHVVVSVEEGSRLNTQVLKRFRLLQAAKHALSPFMRSLMTPLATSISHSASFSRPDSVVSSKNSSSGKRNGGSRRNSSSFSGVTSLGSHTSMLPGNCVPVALFAFVDDFSDLVSSSLTSEDFSGKSFVQSSNATNLTKPGLPAKGTGSVVVLARPASKSEPSINKKLQSSLEAQIRLLVKKSRLQIGSERNRAGLRNGGLPSPTPLLSLDASKAVVLVDKSSNQRGLSLEFSCSLLDEILSGKATTDILLLENHRQKVRQGDIMSLKEFIQRQSDILRGRIGSISTGVGMIAAAVAAATNLASSGKSVTTPELPDLKTWLSNSQFIFGKLVSQKLGSPDGKGEWVRKPLEQPNLSDVSVQRSMDSIDNTVSLLKSDRGLKNKFSDVWCQRVLPAAKEVYLQDLPSCYTTMQHDNHLKKALLAFHSMVRGPAVHSFSKKLEEECISIWKSGRQLCDAVSLTGKPCMHQRHDACAHQSPPDATVSSHSSGYVFLQACACGRSRFSRPDPFDFETTNSSSMCDSECDGLLHVLQLPATSSGENNILPSWFLIRMGDASCYDPAKGLLQSGFCSAQNFLLNWKIILEKPKFSKVSPLSSVTQGSMSTSIANSTEDVTDDVERSKNAGTQLYQGITSVGAVDSRIASKSDKANNGKINLGRDLPIYSIRKPFSEVVAGSAADLDFPPLRPIKQAIVGTDKGIKQNNVDHRSSIKVLSNSALQGSQANDTSSQEVYSSNSSNNYKKNWPDLQVGKSVLTVNLNGPDRTQENSSSKHVVVYVGFEYECPHGHRFILSSDQLTQFSPLDPLSDKSLIHQGFKKVDDRSQDTENVPKGGSPSKTHQQMYGANTTVHRGRRNGKLKERIPRAPRDRTVNDESQLSYRTAESLADSGSAFSLLSKNLPIYIKCPHCRIKNDKDPQLAKYACKTSQLQRIFVVTPPIPMVIAICPIVQFEASCLHPSVPNREAKLQFSPGSNVILPPESFLVLRLPFIYGIQMEDGSWHPLQPFENQPELTAWIIGGTTLKVVPEGRGHSG